MSDYDPQDMMNQTNLQYIQYGLGGLQSSNANQNRALSLQELLAHGRAMQTAHNTPYSEPMPAYKNQKLLLIKKG